MATNAGRSVRRIAAWWRGLSSRWRAVLRWLLPLLIAHVFVAIAYWFNETHGQSLARDWWTVRLAGGAEFVAILVMLIGARRWDTISLGLTLFFAANAPVLMRLLGQVGPRPTDHELNLIRAYYQVGGPILLAGLILWAVSTRIGTRRVPFLKAAAAEPAKDDPWQLLSEVTAENSRLAEENARLRAVVYGMQ